MPEHSPTQWRLDDLDGQRFIVDANGKIVANHLIETAVSPDDIAHIVRCVNTHDEMVQFLEIWGDALRVIQPAIAEKMRQLAAKAKGE